MNIINAFWDDKVFGNCFPEKHKGSWKNWLVFLKAIYGIQMNKGEFKIYQECTERRFESKEGYDSFFAIVGRRGGKSRIVSLIAAYEAVFGKWKKHLAPGQTAHIFIMGRDKDQAKNVFAYIRAFLGNFQDLIKNEKVETIELTNGITLIIKAASSKGVRGYTTAGIILDELAFFPATETDSANPAEEIIQALVPGLLPHGKLTGISTPRGKLGYLYKAYEANYANDDSKVLIWKANTDFMNPGYETEQKNRLIELGISKVTTEYDAEFEENVRTYIPEELLDISIDKYIYERSYDKEKKYRAFIDPAGGSGKDSMTMAIAHQEGNLAILDCVREVKPRFEPKVVAKNFAEILRSYGIYEVRADKYGGEWVTTEFKEHGIRYIPSADDKSKIYYEFAGVLALGQARLLDISEMKKQFLVLERHLGGKEEKIDHLRGQNDDVANAAAGVVVDVFRTISKFATVEDLEARLPHKVNMGGEITSPERKGDVGKTEVVGSMSRIKDDKNWEMTSKDRGKKEDEKEKKKFLSPEEEMRKWMKGNIIINQ